MWTETERNKLFQIVLNAAKLMKSTSTREMSTAVSGELKASITVTCPPNSLNGIVRITYQAICWYIDTTREHQRNDSPQNGGNRKSSGRTLGLLSHKKEYKDASIISKGALLSVQLVHSLQLGLVLLNEIAESGLDTTKIKYILKRVDAFRSSIIESVELNASQKHRTKRQEKLHK